MNLKIPYPDKEVQEKSIQFILEHGLPQKQPFTERLKDIFIGPGFNILFYRSKWILAESVLLYAFLLLFCLAVGIVVKQEEYLFILMFPIMHSSFHSLSCWSEEQDSIIELKESLHFSFYHMVSLRMFYVSIFSAVINVMVTGILNKTPYVGKTCALGLSSLFLFSLLTLLLYEKYHKKQVVFAIILFWTGICLLCSFWGEYFSYFLFETIPLVVHILMVLISFGIFTYYIGKVGNRYAYTCEYY